MPYMRKLESGLWQATVRLPNGRRTTRTDKLKRVVSDWGRDLETQVARGEWRDARQARLRWEEWRDQFMAARVVEPETSRSDRGVLGKHLTPQWEGWRLGAITRIEVQGWVRRMQQAGEGAHAIRRAYTLLQTMMNAAVDEGLITESPCRRIDLPATPTKLPQWFTRAEVDQVAGRLAATGAGRHAAAVHLMAWCGLRWGETAGLRVGRVSWLRRRLVVDSVSDQYGRRKEYPKSSKSRRELPVPEHVLELLAPVAEGRGEDDLLFTTYRQDRPWSGANWRVRWYEALDACPGVPRYNPHTLRHTAASWLVQEGVPLYDVQRLLGHESFAVTARYAHLAPDAHGTVEAAWSRLLTHEGRTAVRIADRPPP